MTYFTGMILSSGKARAAPRYVYRKRYATPLEGKSTRPPGGPFRPMKYVNICFLWYNCNVMKYWLVMYILIDGTWTAGADIPRGGWAPRAYDTLEVCQKRRDFAAKHMKRTGKLEARHFCTQNEAASFEELEQEAAQ